MGAIINICCLVLCVSFMWSNAQTLKKEASMTTPQMIAEAGYPIQKHRVRTADGYILQLHRIPAGKRAARKSEPGAKGKRAVLVVHGLLGCSGDFIVMGPGRSLGYLLADAGYDVWLGNLRGTQYSSHQNLTRDNPQFWEYSFHEHGKYDVPAMVDHVLQVTGLPKLLYIGYSMGTTSFFTFMSTRPEYNEKILAFIGLAPAVYLDNIRPLAEMTLKTIDGPGILRSRGVISASMPRTLAQFLVTNVCNFNQPKADICTSITFFIVGEDYEQSDPGTSELMLLKFQPASWRQLEHFGKIAITGVFTEWMDGLSGDVKPYNLTNIRIPVLLLYGENDQLTEKSQVFRLAQELNTTGVLEDIQPICSYPKINHLDFVFAKDVGKMVNRNVVRRANEMYNKYGPS